MVNFNDYLFHPSGFSKLITEPRSNADKVAGKLSETTKTYLRTIFREVKYKRKSDFESKYTDKGLVKENDGITLFCRVKKQLYNKNTVRINNAFLTGEPDLSDNEDIMKCKHGIDIKCPWSLFTFPFPDDDLDKNYWWQNQCYMSLTGAERWTTAYALMNAPADEILSEKKRLYYKMGMPDPGYDNYDAYIEKCQSLEHNMIFNKSEFIADEPGFDFDTKVWEYDIPLKERLVEFTVNRDEEAIAKIEPTVIKCRAYLNELNKLF